MSSAIFTPPISCPLSASIKQAEHETFFRQMLGEIEQPTIPFGWNEMHSSQPADMRQAQMWLDDTLAPRLHQCAQEFSVSRVSIVYVAWAMLLATVSGGEEIVFGAVLSEQVFGTEENTWSNLLPLRLQVGASDTQAAVSLAHLTLTQLMQHRHAPLWLAQGCSGLAPALPLFLAVICYHYTHAPHRATDACLEAARNTTPAAFSSIETSWENYPLTMLVDDFLDRTRLTVYAKTPISAEHVCALMHTALESLLTALESTPQKALHHLSILPAAERQQVLQEFNATETVLDGMNPFNWIL